MVEVADIEAEPVRRYLRFPVEAVVFVELVAAEFGSTEPATIVRCTTTEVSRDGLRVAIDRELPAGAILQLALELAETQDKLFLVGEVSWSGPVPGTVGHPAWSSGISLFDEGDMRDWTRLIAALEQ
ncbi:MAG: PilZ domain-containing protein [Pseudomonadota bacterium]